MILGQLGLEGLIVEGIDFFDLLVEGLVYVVSQYGRGRYFVRVDGWKFIVEFGG